MIRFVLGRSLSAVLLCAVFACGTDDGKEAGSTDDADDDDSAVAKQDSKDDQDDAGLDPSVIAYDDTEQGLERLFNELIVTLRDKDRESDAARLAESLQLPEPGTWFRDHFGKRGNKLASQYSKIPPDIGRLATLIREAVVDTNQSQVKVDKFTSKDEPNAVGYQLRALEAAQKPLSLYSVRLSSPVDKTVSHIWSFVHVDGTFRFVGKLKNLVGKKDRAESTRYVESARSKVDTLEFTPADAERILASESPPDAGPR